MDIRQIQQFLGVARLGSFGRAAVALHMTQPSLTRNIRALENQLGAQLFERGPRGATLTPAGRKFLPRAQSIAHEADRAIAELDPARVTEGEQARLGVSPNFLHLMAPEAVLAALAEAPHLNVQVSTGTFELMIESLRGREIDLVVSLIPDFSTLRGEAAMELTFEVLANERLIPIAPRGHPALERPHTLAELAAMRWIVPYQMSLLYRFESAFHRRGLSVPMQALNASSMTLERRIALDAGLLCMSAETLARPDLASGEFGRVACPELEFEYLVGLVARQNDLSPASNRLAGHLRAAARLLGGA